MSHESFRSTLSEKTKILPPKLKCDNGAYRHNFLNKESTSNPGSFRSDSSSTLTNNDTQSEIHRLSEKSSNNKDENTFPNQKNAKKIYNVRSTKASRAREELNKKKESQQASLYLGNQYNIAAFKIPLNKTASKQSIQPPEEKPNEVKVTATPPKKEALKTTEVKPSAAKSTVVERTASDANLSERLIKQASRITAISNREYRETFNNRLNTIVAKLESESSVFSDKAKCKKPTVQAKAKIVPIRTKLIDSSYHREKELPTKTENKVVEYSKKPTENKLLKSCRKDVAHSLTHLNKIVGKDLKTSRQSDVNLQKPKIGNRQELDETLDSVIQKIALEKKHLPVFITEEPIQEETDVTIKEFEMQIKQISEGSSYVKELEKSLEETKECEKVAEVNDTSTILIEQLKEQLTQTKNENKNMEKQLSEMTEELATTKLRLQIAETSTENLKTQQRNELANLSKRVAEVDELMSAAVSERELWKVKAMSLEKDLKFKIGDSQRDDHKPTRVENIHAVSGDSKDVTESNIENSYEKKHKTVIKILKTVKKVHLTPEMYKKISLSSDKRKKINPQD